MPDKPELLPIMVKSSVQNIKVPITKDESTVLGKNLAALHMQREYELEKRKESLEAFRASLESIAQSIKKTSRILASGVDEQVAEVEQHFDFNSGTVSTFLPNGGKKVGERPMTVDEKQVPLEVFIDSGAKVKMPSNDLKAV